MDNFAVTVISDTHQPVFGNDQRLHTIRRVVIKIGDRGPFYQNFSPPNDTSAQVNAWIASMKLDVQQVGQ